MIDWPVWLENNQTWRFMCRIGIQSQRNDNAAVIEAATADPTTTTNQTVAGTGAATGGDIQKQLPSMQNQNFAVMLTLAKLLEEPHVSTPHSTLVKNV